MKSPLLYLAAAVLPILGSGLHTASAHDLITGEAHGHYDWSVKPPEIIPDWFFAQADANANRVKPALSVASLKRPLQATVFELFVPRVSVRWDDRYLYVESNGLPAHNMMVGITAWQQQVPLPQNYTGNNAWRLPLMPVPSKTPVSIKGRFLRGAIAIAANGIPIFNPQNNRGEVSAEIGELDQWGGHCGRADDYHYHAAPLHLQSIVGKDKPIAYALDGYPIYGLTEPDGSAPTGLDAFHGHTTPGLGYHYHASTSYPYVNGGFHGEVVEAGGQVDPQPNAQPVRPAGTPLRGAKITGFETTGDTTKLTYEANGEKRAIVYAVNADGTLPFEFQNGSAGTSKETYTRRERRGGAPDNPPPQGDRQRPLQPVTAPASANTRSEPHPSSAVGSLSSPGFSLTSPAVTEGGNLPEEFTGDGEGITPPLEWKGAPAGTRGFALVMHHLDPEGKTKWYWIVYNIPASVLSLPKNVQGVGIVGTGFKGHVGYEPPHSKGPGAKTYVLSLYALSAPVEVSVAPAQVNYEVIMQAIKGRILAKTDLNVVYTSKGSDSGGGPPRRANPAPPPVNP